jgi:UDP-3-O-[3-hydroxymyristoyl] glucosamine N-acyltransferase
MRIRNGFTLGEIPGIGSLLSPSASASKTVSHETPESSRRFLRVDEPGHPASDENSLLILGAGTRLETLAGISRENAGLVLAEDAVTGISTDVAVMRVHNARAVLAAILHALTERIERDAPFGQGNGNTVHPTAVVEGVLEGGVTVKAGAYVAAGSYVGRGSCIEANAVLREFCVVGRDTVVQSGAVLGVAGFGFFAGPSTSSGTGGAELMPHLSGVHIGNHCFIGANTVVAAGVLYPTVVGDGCKLDSHVQIAHNVRLGAGSMLASQSGVAGSTVIGKNFRMGGAASVAGHLRLGDNVSVAAKAGVTKDVADGMTVAGFPARPIGEWRREEIKMRNEE